MLTGMCTSFSKNQTMCTISSLSISLSLALSLSLSLFLSIYIYIYTLIYRYIYIERERTKEMENHPIILLVMKLNALQVVLTALAVVHQ